MLFEHRKLYIRRWRKNKIVYFEREQDRSVGEFTYEYLKIIDYGESMFDVKFSSINIVFNNIFFKKAMNYYDEWIKVYRIVEGKTVQFIEETATISRRIKIQSHIMSPNIIIGDIKIHTGEVSVENNGDDNLKLGINAILKETNVELENDKKEVRVVNCNGVQFDIQIEEQEEENIINDNGDCDDIIVNISTASLLTKLLDTVSEIIETVSSIELFN